MEPLPQGRRNLLFKSEIISFVLRFSSECVAMYRKIPVKEWSNLIFCISFNILLLREFKGRKNSVKGGFVLLHENRFRSKNLFWEKYLNFSVLYLLKCFSLKFPKATYQVIFLSSQDMKMIFLLFKSALVQITTRYINMILLQLNYKK